MFSSQTFVYIFSMLIKKIAKSKLPWQHRILYWHLDTQITERVYLLLCSNVTLWPQVFVGIYRFQVLISIYLCNRIKYQSWSYVLLFLQHKVVHKWRLRLTLCLSNFAPSYCHYFWSRASICLSILRSCGWRQVNDTKRSFTCIQIKLSTKYITCVPKAKCSSSRNNRT